MKTNMGPFQKALATLGEGLDYLTTLTGAAGLKRGRTPKLSLAPQATTTKRRGRPPSVTTDATPKRRPGRPKKTTTTAATTKGKAPQATQVRRRANGELTMAQKIASVMGRKSLDNAGILAALEAKGWASGKKPAQNIAQVFTQDKKAKSPLFERVSRGVYKVRRSDEAAAEDSSGKADRVASTKNVADTTATAGDPPSTDADEASQLAEIGIGTGTPGPNPFAD